LEKIEMKKTLVAVAALAAVTGAMAQATISGAIAFGYDSITNSAAGITQTTKSFGDAPGNSSLNFNVSEDIGNGLKAEGQIGFLPTIDAGGNGAANAVSAAGNTTGYQSFIALSGDFGRIQGGRFADSQALVQFGHDVVNAWGYNPTNGLAAQFGSFFAPNQLKYTTPSIFSGLTLSATKGLGETAGSRVGESTSFAAGYAQGGFSADIAYTKIAASVAIDTTITGLGASYDFGIAKLSGIMTEHQVENQTSTTASSVGVTVPVGAFTFAAQAGTSDNFAVSNLLAPTAVKQTSVDWRVSYALSKRTNIHGVFSTLDGNNGNATAANAAVTGDSRKLSRVFISHSF
jgi:predicted porin